MMKRLRLILLSIMLLAIAGGIEAASRGAVWESVDRWPAQQIEAQPDEPLVAVVDGYVYVAITQRTQVKIFTILGQQIRQETLQPGIYRLKLPSRGIYIFKAGSVTRRLTV